MTPSWLLGTTYLCWRKNIDISALSQSEVQDTIAEGACARGVACDHALFPGLYLEQVCALIKSLNRPGSALPSAHDTTDITLTSSEQKALGQ